MITLEMVKKHLNIDEEYLDDDGYLQKLMAAAEQSVRWQRDRPAADEVDELSTTEEQALLLLVAQWYHSREITGKETNALPNSYDYLVAQSRKFSV